MAASKSDVKMISRLMFRLLPIQILLCAIGSVNGLVSSLFASNSVGSEALSSIGLYNPIWQFLSAAGLLLVGGSQVLCGRFMGANQIERTQNVFSLDITLTMIVSVAATVILALAGAMDLTTMFTGDPVVRKYFNQYLLGTAIGVLPMLMGQQLAAFLSLENQIRRTTVASVVFVFVNLVLNYVFVGRMHLEAFGLALASSLGQWVFFLIQAGYYFSGRSLLRFHFRGIEWKDTAPLAIIGLHGALNNFYQTIRGLIVNGLLTTYIGSAGLSAFAACNNFLALFWAIPAGMLAVSRMMISVSAGEEDRQTLLDIMRIAYRRYAPLMAAISALLIACAVPLTRLYFQNAAAPEFGMTVWGFRLLPVCMPLAVFCMHFVCYGLVMDKHKITNLLTILDGVISVAAFTALLIPVIGMNSVYIANILNGIVSIVVIVLWSWQKRKKLPRNMEDL
ncbi:MAG: hypothetical protein IJH77_06150, partial [Mogibacterium sp.]|nr:hypothetical protein [Mogibacterium sp.]